MRVNRTNRENIVINRQKTKISFLIVINQRTNSKNNVINACKLNTLFFRYAAIHLTALKLR